MQTTIPEKDLQMINAILSPRGDVQSMNINANGRVLSANNGQQVRGYSIESFQGRIVRHQISVIRGGVQIIIAKAGDRYEDIPFEKRSMAFWHESDFK